MTWLSVKNSYNFDIIVYLFPLTTMKKTLATLALWLWLLGNPMANYAQTNQSLTIKETFTMSDDEINKFLADLSTEKAALSDATQNLVDLLRVENEYIAENLKTKESYNHINQALDKYNTSLVDFQTTIATMYANQPKSSTFLNKEIAYVNYTTTQIKEVMTLFQSAVKQTNSTDNE